MRYRKLVGPNLDYSLGHGMGDFYINQPEAVAQSILTRLKLATGEWFLNTAEGTPYSTKVLGANTRRTYDVAFRSRITSSPGVTKLLGYQSRLDPITRQLTVTANVLTQFSTTPVQITVPI